MPDIMPRRPIAAGRPSTTSSSICRFIPAGSRRRALLVPRQEPGGEILVIGVGTGLELPLLPGNVLVTGVDISAPMLRAARARVQRKGLAQVKGLHVMDAAELEFPTPPSTWRSRLM